MGKWKEALEVGECSVLREAIEPKLRNIEVQEPPTSTMKPVENYQMEIQNQ